MLAGKENWLASMQTTRILALGFELSCITDPVGKNLKVLILGSLEFISMATDKCLPQEIDYELLP
jgi:hypothetical protein